MPQKSKAIRVPFTIGGDPDAFCLECRLPCNLEEMSIDCHRRFFLQGLTNCSYFVFGYCFLMDEPGCVFDNGGRHDEYWLQLLNSYFHRSEAEDPNPKFADSRAEVQRLIEEQIKNRSVHLCRYIEEYYQRAMETGGGLSEEMLSRLDEAYMSLLRGITRKPD